VKNRLPLLVESGVEIIISPVFEAGKEWFNTVSDFVLDNSIGGKLRLQLQLHKLLGIE